MATLREKLGTRISTQNERGIVTAEIQYIVESAEAMTHRAVRSMEGLPQRATHTFDGETNCVCSSVKVEPLSEGKTATAKYVYLVTCSFRSDLDNELGDMAENPLVRGPKFTMTSQKLLQERFADLDGKPFVNTAGDPLEKPPPIYEVLRIIKVVRNEATFNEQQVRQFENSVNSDAWSGYPSRTVLCASITGDWKYENGWRYWEKSYEFHVKYIQSRASQSEYDGWLPFRQLNYGPRALPQANATTPEANRDAKGVGSTVTQLLRADGTRITAQQVKDGEAVHYIEFKNFRETNFGELGIITPN